MASKFILASATLLLLGCLTLGVLGIRAGMSSVDAYGIMLAAGDRLHTGAFAESRPPGHPLNEDWALPAFAWSAETSEGPVASEVYGAYQLLGGVVCLVTFALLLEHCTAASGKLVLAVCCFAFSPTFLIESADGEEFLWATACLLGAVLMVTKLANGSFRHPRIGWIGALALAVACSGYRVEIGAVALGMVVLSLLLSERTWAEKGLLLAGGAILFGALWIPLIRQHGASPPYSIPLGWKVRLGVGVYKIVFGLLGVVPMIFGALFFLGRWRRFGIFPPSGRDALGYWLPRLALIFFLLFFCYPMKPAVLLPGLACLIAWGAMQARSWIWIGFVAGCMAVQLVHFDCFRDRAWVGLTAEPSLWSQFYGKKPLFRGPVIVLATREAERGRRVIITDDFPWDFTWNLEHKRWRAAVQPQDTFHGWTQSYRTDTGGIVASRMMIDHPALLRSYVARGYEIWVDAALYREVFQRYAFPAVTSDTGEIEGVPCRLVKME